MLLNMDHLTQFRWFYINKYGFYVEGKCFSRSSIISRRTRKLGKDRWESLFSPFQLRPRRFKEQAFQLFRQSAAPFETLSKSKSSCYETYEFSTPSIAIHHNPLLFQHLFLVEIIENSRNIKKKAWKKEISRRTTPPSPPTEQNIREISTRFPGPSPFPIARFNDLRLRKWACLLSDRVLTREAIRGQARLRDNSEREGFSPVKATGILENWILRKRPLAL